MTHFVVFSKQDCPWCVKAKELITSKGDTYTELDVYEKAGMKEFLQASELRTVPQIYLKGFLIGGYDDLKHDYDLWSEDEE